METRSIRLTSLFWMQFAGRVLKALAALGSAVTMTLTAGETVGLSFLFADRAL
jgi:hypothetical protein